MTCRALAPILCVLAAGCARAPDAAPAGDAWRVQGDALVWQGKAAPAVVRVDRLRGDTAPVLRAAGRITWNDHYTARVFTPVNGRVEELYVEPGARVRRGQPLLRLSSGDFGQWQAEQRKAQADALAARRADDRARDLLAAGVIAQRDAEQAEADRQRADAELARASARLRQLGADGEVVNGSFVLRSPLDGVVVERAASVGTEVRADAATPLYMITDPDKLNVVIDLPEYLAAAVKPGMELEFARSGRSDERGRARLTHVPGAVDPVTRTVRALGVVTSRTAGVPGEAFIQAEIPAATAGAAGVRVPADALVLVGSTYHVFVQEGQRYLRRAVTVVEPGSALVEVSSGVQSGDTVVVDGSLYLEQLLESGAGS